MKYLVKISSSFYWRSFTQPKIVIFSGNLQVDFYIKGHFYVVLNGVFRLLFEKFLFIVI